ncbi:gag-protease polyprotein [Cucumis melo var. makuwa]|nr:gag-protease polyprotein [Cucumis melo var. makuwa]
MLGGDVNKITWEQFKESFYAKFFSANVKYAKHKEFLNLEQGDMTVEQYDVEFDMLSHFALDGMKDEEARTEKFVRDLSLHERVNSSKAAGRVSTLGQKRKVELQPDLTPKRNMRLEGVFQQNRWELAAAGRTLRELPPLTSQQGRVFATTRQEVERAGIVVTGTLPILGHYAFVLFDFGSSHSFISSVFVEHVDLEVEPLNGVFSVSTPSGEVLLSKEKIKACWVEIESQMLDVTSVRHAEFRHNPRHGLAVY